MKIERPTVMRPDFSKPNAPAYDYRNMENAGQYRGVGEAGKIATKGNSSVNAMPPEKKDKKVPRDHEG